jgi:hypothetical protein
MVLGPEPATKDANQRNIMPTVGSGMSNRHLADFIVVCSNEKRIAPA